MKLRLLPLLVIVCVPLRNVGALPQPALDASAPTCADGAVSPSPPLNAVPVAAAVRSTGANAGPRSLRAIIRDSFLQFGHRVLWVSGHRGGRSPVAAEDAGRQAESVRVSRPSRQGTPWLVSRVQAPSRSG